MKAVLLLLLTVVAYFPATRGDFIWDDDLYVWKNPLLREPGGLAEIWLKPESSPQYYPLVFTSFWVEYKLWDLAPRGYHWTNILLHSANAILVWLVLRRLAVPGSWFIGALFAVHPVHVESVAWITERKNVLSAFFYGLAMLAFLRCFLPTEPQQKAAWRGYLLGTLFFVGALLSKTVTCSLPAALVLILWWKNGRIGIRNIIALLPIFAIGAGFAYLTVHLEKEHVGAQGDDWAFSIADRCLIAGRAVWFYAFKLLVPLNLSFIYPRWTVDAAEWMQWFFPVSALALVVSLWLLRNRLGRGPLIAVLYFGGTLLPALGFFNVYPMLFSFVWDHFQYLASLGILALATATVWALAGQRATTALKLLGVIVILALTGLTWRQTLVYANLETLWRDTLAKNPRAWMAHYLLGEVLTTRAANDPSTARTHWEEAVQHFQKVVELRPSHWMAHTNLGFGLLFFGKVDDALPHLHQAADLAKDKAFVHVNLAEGLKQKGKADEALAAVERGLSLDPKYAAGHLLKANLHLAQKRMDEAMAAFQAALESDPKMASAAFELGKLLVERSKIAEGVANLQKAVELQPTSVPYRIALGNALQKLGRNDEANVHFRRALELDPNSPLR